MRRLILLLSSLPLLALASPALAAPDSEARAAAGESVTVAVAGGLTDGGQRYAMTGQRLAVAGHVRPAAPGRTVSIEIFLDGELDSRESAGVRPDGRFASAFTARQAGRYTVRATLPGPDASPGASSERVAVQALDARARPGARGRDVRLLQRGLRALAFVAPLNGRYDAATGRAVIAFRKTNRMARTPRASAAVFRLLFEGRGGYRLRYPRAGKHVEFDLSRQVLVLARGGRPERIYHSSSGAPATPTVLGTFRFYRRQWGTNAKGMVHSVFFIRGYAIHGFRSVPTRPASHGCLRVPIPNALSIARWISLGDRIDVYR